MRVCVCGRACVRLCGRGGFNVSFMEVAWVRWGSRGGSGDGAGGGRGGRGVAECQPALAESQRRNECVNDNSAVPQMNNI